MGISIRKINITYVLFNTLTIRILFYYLQTTENVICQSRERKKPAEQKEQICRYDCIAGCVTLIFRRHIIMDVAAGAGKAIDKD